MTDVSDITARLNLDHISAAAIFAANQIKLTRTARVELTPGDHTRYPITIVAPTVVYTTAGPEFRDK